MLVDRKAGVILHANLRNNLIIQNTCELGDEDKPQIEKRAAI